VTGDYGDLRFRSVRMLPLPEPRPQLLIGGSVDRVLRRVATLSDGWLTYFYTADSFSWNWRKIRDFAEQAGRDPAELTNVAQLPVCVAASFEEADKKARQFVGEYFDVAEWSESTPDSAIRGTPQQCAEQLTEHIDAGARHIVLVPYNYALDQVEALASDVLPLIGHQARRAGA
jgi:alkanesulfonate monooxygenase SsuD/methylene tetrahydromethanopterin reductase-like flavin-dependent oxidoreductase (luciferase family)